MKLLTLVHKHLTLFYVSFSHIHKLSSILFSTICLIKHRCRLRMFRYIFGEIMSSKHVFGITIVIPLLFTLYLNDFTLRYVLWFEICIFCFVLFKKNYPYISFRNNLLITVNSKIIIIALLKMNFRTLADRTLECFTNYYNDGNGCKGIVNFKISNTI